MVNASAARSPHHQVATEGIASGSPSNFLQAPGRNPGSAADSIRPLPRALATRDVAGTHGLQQARNAERRIAAQFERVAVVVIQPAEQRMYTPQAAECSEVDAIAAHRQVLSFDQGKTEIARQIGVFEVGFVVGSRRQQDD
jgi:hypothetical protein